MYVTQYEEGLLAMSLANLVKPHMPRAVRVQTFARIGAGDATDMIGFLVDCCQRYEVELPGETVLALRNWLSGYVGTEVEDALGPKLSQICGIASQSCLRDRAAH